MGEWIGRGRKARRSYGFDEVAIVPGSVTIDPEDTDISWKINDQRIDLPIMAAAMDGVVVSKPMPTNTMFLPGVCSAT